MNGVLSDMPKQSDKTKKQLVIPATNEKIVDTNTYNSQRRAIKKYEGTIEQITVRLPKGSRNKLNEYITRTGKYKSVNTMIKSLLETEIGFSLD